MLLVVSPFVRLNIRDAMQRRWVSILQPSLMIASVFDISLNESYTRLRYQPYGWNPNHIISIILTALFFTFWKLIFQCLLALHITGIFTQLPSSSIPSTTLQTITVELQWNCSGITAMHFELQWTMACSETLQSAEVNSCKFCSDPNAKSFAVIICRNCSEILHCQNCI